MAVVTNVASEWFDSTLWTRDVSESRHALLAIKVRVALNCCGATTLDNGQETIDWDDGRAARWFKDRLKREVEGAWSGRFFLVPDRDWAGSFGRIDPVFGRIRSAPAIECRLVVETDLGGREPHLIIDTYRLPKGPDGLPRGFGRSSASRETWGNRTADWLCSWVTRMSRATFDTADVLPRPDNHQIPAVHEFGHYLGLEHVNAAEARRRGVSTNSAIAYQSTTGDYMGSGTNFYPWHAFPWCKRLRQHLPSGPQFERSPSEQSWHGHQPLVFRTHSGLERAPAGEAPSPEPVHWRIAMQRPRALRTYTERPIETAPDGSLVF